MRDKKVLVVATVIGFITSFETSDIELLQSLDYQVHLATNSQVNAYPDKIAKLEAQGVVIHHIPFARSPFSKQNLTAYRQLCQLIKDDNYQIVHCHTPVGGVFGRMAAHKAHTPVVIYTAHGFHFFKGAPKRNWIIFYPIERALSHWTDILININLEDYNRAKADFSAKETIYVPGVGVDVDFFGQDIAFAKKQAIRQELGIPDDAIFLLSVGELNANKNHERVIRAIAGLPADKKAKLYYAIASEGSLKEYLQQLIDQLGLKNQVKLLGYRNDVAELLHAADIYILPSLREGLNVSLQEAMASGVLCLAGNIRGNVDLIQYPEDLFDPKSIDDISRSLGHALNTMGEKRDYTDAIQRMDRHNISKKMLEIYSQADLKVDKKER